MCVVGLNGYQASECCSRWGERKSQYLRIVVRFRKLQFEHLTADLEDVAFVVATEAGIVRPDQASELLGSREILMKLLLAWDDPEERPCDIDAAEEEEIMGPAFRGSRGSPAPLLPPRRPNRALAGQIVAVSLPLFTRFIIENVIMRGNDRWLRIAVAALGTTTIMQIFLTWMRQELAFAALSWPTCHRPKELTDLGRSTTTH